MKKTTLLLLLMLGITSCNGDALVTQNFLSQNYDTNTKNIDLSAMNLTIIPDFSEYGSGAVFFNATSIDLTTNDIHKMNMGSFSRFESLREINLSNNQISSLQELKINLDVLSLSNNKIENISFDEDAILRDLYLSGNLLRSGKSIVIPPKLVMLDISSNKLEDIEGLGKGDRLKYLDISYNLLEDTDLTSLKGKNTIQYLDVVGNPDMSSSRIETLNIFNQKYIDATTFKARPKETLSGSLTE